ncbi:hypothetical protein COLO4_31423 [Corchorus olitorius]|uniref:Uncharacterized protein n=1 Tax=Corchorus olitorius TaxID=93759 RepID=A0A1R3H498_9ROSI|nr:hypothetical protein COLO4_31423 [Corchorus olitorius]
MSAARSVLRSAASRATAATRLASGPRSIPRPACSPFRISTQSPLSRMISSFANFNAFRLSPELRLDP